MQQMLRQECLHSFTKDLVMNRRWVAYSALVAAIIASVEGFNLAPDYAQVFENPTKVDTYFGYSIGLQSNKAGSYWMIVGAPKANSSLGAQKDISEPGVVYKCNTMSANASCIPLLLDFGRNEMEYQHVRARKDHSWIGAAIDVTAEGGLLACGPKWTNMIYSNENLVNGICYWTDNTFSSGSKVTKLMPLTRKEDQGIDIRSGEDEGNVLKTFFYYAYGEAGFSAHITKGGNEFLLGAPGVLDWTGTVIRCKEQERVEVPNNRRRRQIKSSADIGFDIANPYQPSKLDAAGYFGYAVSSGYFLSAKKLSYVTSAPREAAMRGAVHIFDYTVVNYNQLVHDFLVTLEGTQLGEYFGSAICVVDLNNDRMDDLVVGAPLHSLTGSQGSRQASGDEGRVYVFINEGNRIMREIGDDTKIMGMQIPGARFGTCISHVGDLNKDGYNDFAVGAPFEEDGRGAVYIYHGAQTGVKQRHSQRITAQEIHPALTGFGYSISRGVDIDNNNYNDLAVGAVSSGHGVLVRSRPVVLFNAFVRNDAGDIAIEDTAFNVSACLRYQGRNVPPTVDVQIFVSVWSRTEIKSYIRSEVDGAGLNNTHSYYATLQFGRDYCRSVQITLVKGSNLHEYSIDYTKPYEMKMSYIIDERRLRPPKRPNTVHRGDTFCKNCPVVDPNDQLSTTTDIPYATGCKDLICKTDLKIAASFEESVRSPYVIGSQASLRLHILIDNSGESAYLAKLRVKIPRSTPLVRIPSRCQEHATDQEVHLECDIGNPLRTSSQAHVNLELSFKDLPSSLESLSYDFNATSSGADGETQNNVRTLTLELEAVADMEIVGVSTQNELVYLPGNTQTFTHKYEVMNYGPSPASAASLEFHIPVAYVSGDEAISFLEVYQPTLHLNKQPFACKALGAEFSVRKQADSGESEESGRVERATTNDTDSKSPIDDLPMNMTFHVNCTNQAVECMTVKCDSVGPFSSKQSRTLVSFKMKANLTRLAAILGRKDIIVVSSSGSVTINPLLREKQPTHGRADFAAVSTVFYGSIRDEALPAWIWILAIVGGIALLLIMTGVLYQVGFFKRKAKEDLQSLKDDESNGAHLDSMNNQGFDDKNAILEDESEGNGDVSQASFSL